MKFYEKILYLAFFMFLGGTSVSAEIISASTLQDVQLKIEKMLSREKAEDIMVVFDLDETLVMYDHPAATSFALKKYAEIYKEIMSSLTPLEKDFALTILTQEIPQKLIDKKKPQIIKSLQKKDIKIIALTSLLVNISKNSKKKAIFEKRDQLQKKGIDFTASLRGMTRVVPFFDFPQYGGQCPLFYHGILTSNGRYNGIGKGAVLGAFLTHIGPRRLAYVGAGYEPKVVVLVAACKKNLREVDMYFQEYFPKIQFIGIEYQGAQTYVSSDVREEEFREFWNSFAQKGRKKALQEGFLPSTHKALS